jgi:hypothetical protein
MVPSIKIIILDTLVKAFAVKEWTVSPYIVLGELLALDGLAAHMFCVNDSS